MSEPIKKTEPSATVPFEAQRGVGSSIGEEHHQRWGNARLLLEHDETGSWVIKDFSVCHPAVRSTWSQLLLRREYKACNRLDGLEGVPQSCTREGPFALRYRFMPGSTLREAHDKGCEFPADFFLQLENLVAAMHARHIVHLDLRNARNILLQANGRPALLDFQTALSSRCMLPPVRRLLENVDRSAVYKHWHKIDPAGFDPDKAEWLQRFERWRPLWLIEGYALQKWKKRRQERHQKSQGSK